MSTEQATVEVLTAEVRVLMVGSRQVTLSVVRQLDVVSAETIVPFGRIRADAKAPGGTIEVVGSTDGLLTRARAGAVPHLCLRKGSYGPGVFYLRVELLPSQEIYESFAKLPLIVLAGLR